MGVCWILSDSKCLLKSCAPKSAIISSAWNGSVSPFPWMQCAAESRSNDDTCPDFRSNYLPDMTNAFEIKVPAQKNWAGVVPVCMRATIHGNEPGSMYSPPQIRSPIILGIPHVSVLLLDRLITTSEGFVTITHTAITMRNLIIASTFSTFSVKGQLHNYVFGWTSPQQCLSEKNFSLHHVDQWWKKFKISCEA